MDDLVERLRLVSRCLVYENSESGIVDIDTELANKAANEVERLRTVTANAKDELSRLRKAQEAHEETATKLNSYINLAGDQIDEIQKLKDILHNSGIVEIAGHNNRVTEYMFHWEGRALDAEAEIERLKDVLIGISCDPSDCELGRGGCYYGDKEEHCPHKIAREAVKD